MRAKRKKSAEDQMTDLKETALDVAGAGSEALKEFVSTTGSAAKEFATSASSAAKELLDTVEKAGERLNRQTKPHRRRGRKLFKMTIAFGAAGALLANETVRGALSGMMRKVGGGTEPEPWQPATTNAEVRQDLPQTSAASTTQT